MAYGYSSQATINNTTQARGASKAGRLMFYQEADRPGAYVLLERMFTPTQNLTSSYAQPGCGTPPEPSGVPVSCEVRLWVKPDLGARGALQLINNSTWTYLASLSFTLTTPSSSYQMLTLTTNSCSEDMVVRVVIEKSSSYAESVYLDDLSVIRYYN